VAALLAVGLYGSHLVREFYLDQLKADLEARAWLCGKPAADLLAHGQIARIDSLCKEMGRPTPMRITVVLPSGQVVGDSDENPRDMDNHKERPEIQEALAGSPGHSIRFSSTEQEERFYVAIPLIEGGSPTAVVRTSVSVAALNETLRGVRDWILIACLIGAALHVPVSLWISRRISRPLEEMRAGAERFAAGDLSHRLRAEGSEEICTLAEAMNRMAEQLAERIQTILRQQNEHEAMLSSMEEGVLAVDTEGTILSLNATCATLLGGDWEKLKGRTVYEVIRKPDLLRFVESAMSSASPVDGELRIHGPQERWLSAHGTALHDAQRGRIGVLVVLHDVTRLRHLENVRRDFVANVSHELRTPVTSIKGFIETLLEGALEDKENARRFLQIMLRQVNRLDAIIGDLLVLSRIEKGSEEQMIELASDSIRTVLQAAAEMCDKKAAAKGVRIEIACPEDLVAQINSALLEQAVINLLDNAIKYSEANSAVQIIAAREGAELVLRVKDQGCGIEAKHLPRLFERFYRVDQARSRELGGTGLGLAIVKHIALAHRGSVSVESRVGAGSTFSLRLPATHPAPPS
jgi:two-component system phosphate regulon sensor histidine kinase PhoR